MSLFQKMFGGKTDKPLSPQEAIQNLLQVEDLLTKRQDFLEKKIDDELQIAKTNGITNKTGKGIKLDNKTLTYRFGLSVLYNKYIVSHVPQACSSTLPIQGILTKFSF